MSKRKMSKAYTKFILGLFWILSGIAFAGEQDGTRGGGQTVDVNGHPALRDLVDKTSCIWISASAQAAQEPHFSRILDNLEGENWYLRESIEREMQNLSVCVTEAPLISISVEDQDLVTVYSPVRGKQVAIRLNGTIYLNRALNEQLDEVHRAYLLLHETMHSFLPLGVSMRNTKLRSFVAAAYSLETSPMPTEQFALQIKNNSIELPHLGGVLDLRPDYEIFSRESSSLEDRVRAIRKICGASVENCDLSYRDLNEAIAVIKRADRRAKDQAVEREQQAVERKLKLERAKLELKNFTIRGNWVAIREIQTQFDLDPITYFYWTEIPKALEGQTYFFSYGHSLSWVGSLPAGRRGRMISKQIAFNYLCLRYTNSLHIAVALGDQAMLVYLLNFATMEDLTSETAIEVGSVVESGMTPANLANALNRTEMVRIIHAKQSQLTERQP